tara:strand:+ start:558 stop:755 length:198 start_codon:yes stop_codon:yes gene_type:complete
MKTNTIRDLIKQRGVRMNWLSDRLNISAPYLSLILAEKRPKPSWFDSRVISILSEPLDIINNKEA